MSDQLLIQILDKLDNMESEIRTELKNINAKLDSITEQVARNTEEDTGLSAKVEKLETDVRLIKKLLTN